MLLLFSPHGRFFLLDHNGYLLKENSCSDPFYTSLLPFLTSKLSFSRLYCSSHPLCPSPQLFLFTFTATLGVKTRAFYRLGVCPATGLGSLLPKVASWATESWVCAERQGALSYIFLSLVQFLWCLVLSLDCSAVDCIFCFRRWILSFLCLPGRWFFSRAMLVSVLLWSWMSSVSWHFSYSGVSASGIHSHCSWKVPR